jgi:hypothetical protein
VRRAVVLLAAALAACASPARHVPPFARQPYQGFSREAVVALALREWRAFGSPVDDAPPVPHPHKAEWEMPERQEGLWQRVGEYWWLGLDAGARETRWTGKHDENGRVFAADDDEAYAWSAAFVSYVMRIAGAGTRFPYAPAHHVYIDAAKLMAMGKTVGWVVSAERLELYAPIPGDLICYSRTAPALTYDDLPAGRFAAHCDIVVATGPTEITVIGGNVDDAVTMKHVPVTLDGRLAGLDRPLLDTRYPWFVALRLIVAGPSPAVATAR